MKRLVLVLAILLGNCSIICAQPYGNNVERISLTGFMYDMRAVVVEGDYAYVADRFGGVRIVNIRNLRSPDMIGFCYTPGTANAVAISGDYVFLANGETGVRIIDKTTPNSPREVAAITEPPGDVNDVIVVDDHLFLACNEGLWIFDISNPTNPQEVSLLYGESLSSLVMQNDIVYASSTNRLTVIDVSNKSSPRMVTQFNTPGSPSGIAIGEDYIYLANAEGLLVIDVSDLGNIQIVGTFDSPGSAAGVVIFDDNAFIADGLSGLRVLDISDPTNPREVGNCELPGVANKAVFRDDYIFMTSGDGGLRIVDVMRRSAPGEVGRWASINDINAIAVNGDYAFIIDRLGVWILNVSDPESVEKISFIYKRFASSLNCITVNNDYLYFGIGASPYRLFIYDISDITLPSEVGSLALQRESAQEIRVVESYAYLGHDIYFSVIDISDLSNPIIVGQIVKNRFCLGFAVRNDYAYLAYGEDGFIVLDLIRPNSPRQVVSLDLDDYCRRLEIKDQYAFMVSGSSILYAINIENPINPFVVNTLRLLSRDAYDIAINSNHAFIAVDNLGLKVVDISNPDSLHEVGNYLTDNARKVAYNDSLIFLAEGSNLGIYRFTEPQGIGDNDVSLPKQFQLLPSFPNPFNSTTMISYDLPSMSKVNLSIYDLTGRHVTDLLNGDQTRGKHQVVWRADNYPSGVYMIHMEADGYSTVRKAVLMR